MHGVSTTLPDGLSLLLIDDHLIFLDGLSLALSSLADNLRLDCAANTREAEALLAAHDYDLILLDLRLPGESGIDLLQRWQREGRDTPVAVLSASDAAQDVHGALRAGALGFIAKSSSGAQLRDAVARLLLGERLPAPEADNGGLTPRQRDILLLLAQGLPNKAIGRQLHLSEETVKTHLRSLFQLLHVHTRTACVSAARLRGWL